MECICTRTKLTGSVQLIAFQFFCTTLLCSASAEAGFFFNLKERLFNFFIKLCKLAKCIDELFSSVFPPVALAECFFFLKKNSS